MRALLIAIIWTFAMLVAQATPAKSASASGLKGTQDYGRCVECTNGAAAPSEQAVKSCVIIKRSAEEINTANLKGQIRLRLAAACDSKLFGPETPECLFTFASQMAVAAC